MSSNSSVPSPQMPSGEISCAVVEVRNPMKACNATSAAGAVSGASASSSGDSEASSKTTFGSASSKTFSCAKKCKDKKCVESDALAASPLAFGQLGRFEKPRTLSGRVTQVKLALLRKLIVSERVHCAAKDSSLIVVSAIEPCVDDFFQAEISKPLQSKQNEFNTALIDVCDFLLGSVVSEFNGVAAYKFLVAWQQRRVMMHAGALKVPMLVLWQASTAPPPEALQAMSEAGIDCVVALFPECGGATNVDKVSTAANVANVSSAAASTANAAGIVHAVAAANNTLNADDFTAHFVLCSKDDEDAAKKHLYAVKKKKESDELGSLLEFYTATRQRECREKAKHNDLLDAASVRRALMLN